MDMDMDMDMDTEIEKIIRQYKLSKIIEVEHQENFDILDNLYNELKSTHSTKDANVNVFDYNLYFFDNDKLLFAIRPFDKFMWFCHDHTNINRFATYGDRILYVFAVIKDLYNIEVVQINIDFSSSEIEEFGDLYEKYS